MASVYDNNSLSLDQDTNKFFVHARIEPRSFVQPLIIIPNTLKVNTLMVQVYII